MKSEFLTSLDVRDTPDEKWQLISALRYASALLDRVIEVPAGFITDLASVPRVPVVYSLWGDRSHHESVIHDFAYRTHFCSKAQADKMFLEAMAIRGKSWWIRWPMYMAVKLGGRKSWESGPGRYAEQAKSSL